MNIKIEKEFIQIFNNRKDKPSVVVMTILTEEGDTGRGISICWKEDKFSIQKGKAKARHQAIRGVLCRKTKPIERYQEVGQLIESKCPYAIRSECDPNLSFLEAKNLFSRRTMRDNVVVTEEQKLDKVDPNNYYFDKEEFNNTFKNDGVKINYDGRLEFDLKVINNLKYEGEE